MHLAAAVLATGLLPIQVAGCGSDESKPSPVESAPEGCNPIAFEHDCLLPYPSDVFNGEQGPALTTQAAPYDPFTVHAADGFSPGSQILALFPQGVDDAPLVSARDDLTASLGDDSPTVLLSATTGERLLHLAELDPRAPTDDRRALVIRPLTRLSDGDRIIVAVRGLSDREGALLPAPRGFAALRDGGKLGGLESLMARYDADVFAPLEAAGVERASLQLAWDFTVRSDAHSDATEVRDLVIGHLETQSPVAALVDVEVDPDEHTFRRIEMTATVPLYLETDEPLARLSRDDRGAVQQNGTTELPFTVWVPKSLEGRPAGSPPARLMQFGHGFFGDRGEVNSFIAQLANEQQFVVVAADWIGMSEEDRIPVVDNMAADIGRAMVFIDRVHQAFANFIILAHIAKNSLAADATLAIDGAPAYDPATLYYYGISQGGILGGSYVALSPYVDKAVLSVGGANFSLMMFRARPFLPFLAFLQLSAPDWLDQQKFVALSQTSFDRVDPLTFAPLVSGPLLMQIGIGDDQVPNIASHLHARAIGVDHLTPAPRDIEALGTIDTPTDRALVEFDFGITPLPGEVAQPPTEANEAHEGVRRLEAAKEQLNRFFEDGGLIEHTCAGPCDPE